MEIWNKQTKNWYQTSWWKSIFHQQKIRDVGTCQREWCCVYDRGTVLEKKTFVKLSPYYFPMVLWGRADRIRFPTAFFQPPILPRPHLVIVPKSDCSILISPLSNKGFSNVPGLVKHGNTHDSRTEIRMHAQNQSWKSPHQANILRLGSSQLFILRQSFDPKFSYSFVDVGSEMVAHTGE